MLSLSTAKSGALIGVAHLGHHDPGSRQRRRRRRLWRLGRGRRSRRTACAQPDVHHHRRESRPLLCNAASIRDAHPVRRASRLASYPSDTAPRSRQPAHNGRIPRVWKSSCPSSFYWGSRFSPPCGRSGPSASRRVRRRTGGRGRAPRAPRRSRPFAGGKPTLGNAFRERVESEPARRRDGARSTPRWGPADSGRARLRRARRVAPTVRKRCGPGNAKSADLQGRSRTPHGLRVPGQAETALNRGSGVPGMPGMRLAFPAEPPTSRRSLRV